MIRIGRLRDARSAASVRVALPLCFIKAFALVARDHPELRQLYFRWPWANVYEHPSSVAMLAIHRERRGEPWLFWGRFVSPESIALVELQRQLDAYLHEPVETAFRQQLQLSALPTTIRRTVLWWNLNLSGPARARRTGTCFLSTLARLGAEIQSPPAFLTSNITYGPMDEAGNCRLTIGYDHRLMDGRLVAVVLAEIEETLNETIVAEIRGMTAPSGAAQARAVATPEPPATTRPLPRTLPTGGA